MGRSPCCDEVGLKKGPWTPEEDKKLVEHIQRHGHGSWRSLPKKAGLNRCGKSCRLRWTNYLRPDIKRGKFSVEEEQMIIQLHSLLGNKWSTISRGLPGRTDNEIKNYWNTHLKKKLLLMGIDPVTHRRRADLNLIANLPGILAAATANYQNLIGNLGMPLNNALRLQAEAVNLVLQTLIQSMAAASTATTTSPTNPIGDYIVAAAASPSGPAPMLQDLATNPCTSESIKLEINSSNGGAPRAHSGEQAAAAAATAMAAYMANSPASISLDVGLHGLDVGESDDSMICWKEIIDQICWSSEFIDLAS